MSGKVLITPAGRTHVSHLLGSMSADLYVPVGHGAEISPVSYGTVSKSGVDLKVSNYLSSVVA